MAESPALSSYKAKLCLFISFSSTVLGNSTGESKNKMRGFFAAPQNDRHKKGSDTAATVGWERVYIPPIASARWMGHRFVVAVRTMAGKSKGKGKDKGKSKGKEKSNSRSPSGMTTRNAGARARTRAYRPVVFQS